MASDRGALPETLGDAGFVFTLPERCTPAGAAVPTVHEVAPIERPWYDPAWEAAHVAADRKSARRFGLEALEGRDLTFVQGGRRQGPNAAEFTTVSSVRPHGQSHTTRRLASTAPGLPTRKVRPNPRKNPGFSDIFRVIPR
jgi:hypothetical protein